MLKRNLFEFVALCCLGAALYCLGSAMWCLGSMRVACGACGTSPPSDAGPPPAVDAGRLCPVDAGCCDAGHWTCSTLEVPCQCPP
jgi:hypothetical protein